jgi:hypothetical protein
MDQDPATTLASISSLLADIKRRLSRAEDRVRQQFGDLNEDIKDLERKIAELRPAPG